MKIIRYFDMPNAKTFTIPSIGRIVYAMVGNGQGWVDPFANENSPAEITNDLNEAMPTNHHMDAVAFLKMFDDCSKKGVLLDPPYSFHQIVECYEGVGKMKQIGAVYRETARVLGVRGLAITFGWNSNGVGAKRGFRTEAIHLIAHGGSHNDTIITVQRKMGHQRTLFDAPTGKEDHGPSSWQAWPP